MEIDNVEKQTLTVLFNIDTTSFSSDVYTIKFRIMY